MSKIGRGGRAHSAKEKQQELAKQERARKKAERRAAGKKEIISLEQFEKKVRELINDGKSNQQAIKSISQKYEIR